MGKFKIRGPLQLGTSVVFMHEGSDVMCVADEQGNMLGVAFNADGTFTLGGWDTDGEWVELTACARMIGGALAEFPLDQYDEPDQPEDDEETPN